MKKAVLATKNKGKLKELKELLKDLNLEIIALDEFSDKIGEIIEDGKSFFENAMKKAKIVAEKTGLLAIADDSGLEVDALNGKPDIYSARFAGENATDEENNQKLLNELKDIPLEKRTGRFKCVIVAYRPDGKWISVEGTCEGKIALAPKGEHGFGYDPIFIPEGYDRTMAELTSEEKNKISHRGDALRRLKEKISELL